MNTRRALALVALILAVLAIVPVAAGFPLLAIAVMLLALVYLV
jgi:flagellar biosynthesis component FlhA